MSTISENSYNIVTGEKLLSVHVASDNSSLGVVVFPDVQIVLLLRSHVHLVQLVPELLLFDTPGYVWVEVAVKGLESGGREEKEGGNSYSELL